MGMKGENDEEGMVVERGAGDDGGGDTD